MPAATRKAPSKAPASTARERDRGLIMRHLADLTTRVNTLEQQFRQIRSLHQSETIPQGFRS